MLSTSYVNFVDCEIRKAQSGSDLGTTGGHEAVERIDLGPLIVNNRIAGNYGRKPNS